MRVAIPLLVVALAAAPSLALAETTVETVPLLTRESAEAVLTAAERALPQASVQGTRFRVVRRYVRGLGWRHFVVAEGVGEGRQRALVAASLAVEGKAATIVESKTEDAPGAAPPPRGVSDPPPPPDAQTPASASDRVVAERPRTKSAMVVVRAAARAHGGETDTRARLEAADRVEFRFVRTLPERGPLVAQHVYSRSGPARRLDVEIKAGEGTASSAGVDAEGTAWLQERGGEVLSREPESLTQVVDRFAPLAVLSAGLDLGLELSTGTAWQGLERVGATGGSVVVLRPPMGGTPGGLVEAVFDANTHRLEKVTWRRREGQITFVYGDFSDLGDGLVIPLRMAVRERDRTIEEIEVESLVIDGKIGAGRFSKPQR